MALYMKANSKMGILMDMGNIMVQMVQHIEALGLMINKMELEMKFILMVLAIMAISKKGKKMEMEN